MVTCYFGVPGVGKTTILTKDAVRGLNLVKRGHYDDVYTNFYCKGCKRLDFKVLDKYKIENSLIILDEITLDADNRKFKSFPDGVRDFFILHRHLGNDIIYATQSYEMVDLKIRQVTQELWYMTRSVVPILSEFTTAKRIYRQININEHTSELTLGYRFCNLVEAFFTSNFKTVFRRKYYKYFDSFEQGALENRPVFVSTLWDDPKSALDSLPTDPRELLCPEHNILY